MAESEPSPGSSSMSVQKIPKYPPLDPEEMVQRPRVEEVVALMRCIFCRDFPLLGLSLCSAGHLSCTRCAVRTVSGRCPAMGRGRGRTCGRPQSPANVGPLGKLYTRATYRCPNAKCQEVLPGSEITDHTTHCDFRIELECILMSCPVKSRIALPHYLDHLVTFHHIPATNAADLTDLQIVLPSRKLPLPNVWMPTILEAFDRQFLLVIKEDNQGFRFFCFVLDEDQNTEFRIRIESQPLELDYLTPQFRYCGDVERISMLLADAFNYRPHFFLNKQMVYQDFLMNGDSFNIGVSIEELVEQNRGALWIPAPVYRSHLTRNPFPFN